MSKSSLSSFTWVGQTSSRLHLQENGTSSLDFNALISLPGVYNMNNLRVLARISEQHEPGGSMILQKPCPPSFIVVENTCKTPHDLGWLWPFEHQRGALGINIDVFQDFPIISCTGSLGKQAALLERKKQCLEQPSNEAFEMPGEVCGRCGGGKVSPLYCLERVSKSRKIYNFTLT